MRVVFCYVFLYIFSCFHFQAELMLFSNMPNLIEWFVVGKGFCKSLEMGVSRRVVVRVQGIYVFICIFIWVFLGNLTKASIRRKNW